MEPEQETKNSGKDLDVATLEFRKKANLKLAEIDKV